MAKPNKSDEFFKAIKAGETVPVYLFYGEDGAMVSRAVKAVEDQVVEPGMAEFNTDYFHGREADASEVAAAARTMSMMGGKRLVVFKRIDELRVTSRGPIMNYLQSPNPDTVLVITATEFKEKDGTGKENSDKSLLAAVNKVGTAVYFRRPYANQLPAVIQNFVREQGKTIDGAAVKAMVDLAGDDTLGVEQQVAKVCIYVGDRGRITEADVIEAGADIKEAGAFEFTDALGDRDLDTVLRLFRRMREQGQELMPILGMIARHFRLIWKIKEALDRGDAPRAVARKVGINEFIFDKAYMPRIKRYKTEEAGRIQRVISDLDTKLKSTSGDKEVLFERALIAIVSGRLV